MDRFVKKERRGRETTDEMSRGEGEKRVGGGEGAFLSEL